MNKKQKSIQILSERLRPGLHDVDRQYLESCELGDDDLVRNLLNSGRVSPDQEDTQGRTALDLAIANGHVSLVVFLSGKVGPKVIHQGLLCAVENGREEICEILLENSIYQSTLKENTNEYSSIEGIMSSNGDKVSEIFDDDSSMRCKTSQLSEMTIKKMLKEALIKAAIRNNFQIVQMVMIKGASVDIPHDYFCSCKSCLDEQTRDYMVFCNRRLDTFRALASPAYISLTEEDPVMASFFLSKKFKQLQVMETEYKSTYEELDSQVQGFTLELLNQCRTSEEVRYLLDSPENDESSPESFPLLHVALQMEQKKFVSHPKCQAQVSALWFSGLKGMRHLNRFEFLMLSIPLGMVILPILSLVFILAPWSKVTLLLNTPSTRFLSYTCSYITFLCLIVLGKIQFSNMWVSLGCDQTTPISYVIIVLIFMWIIGWIWEEIKQLFDQGAINYFRSVWNIIDSLMLTFLLTSFTLDFVIPIRLRSAMAFHQLNYNVSGENININQLLFCYEVGEGASYFSPDNQCPTSTVGVDWMPDWIPDPELIADIMFSAGIILSIARISFIMPANETFGTMLVSFRRTFGDLVKLLAMFVLILLSFSCGLAALYAAHVCQTPHFQGFSGVIFVLIWSLLGFGEGNTPVLNRSAPMTSITNNPSRIELTEWFGYAIYGVYVFAAIVVLMNLLIAVMSNTFQEVQDERDTEWKFSRTELWMTFIEPGCPVAPPFNIIPTVQNVCTAWKKFLSICVSCRKHKLKINKKRKSKKRLDEEMTYSPSCPSSRQSVMCALIQRYIVQASREKLESDEDASEDRIRRLIERTSSRLDKRLDEITGHVQHVDDHVSHVDQGEKDIQQMQKEEMKMTNLLLKTQEKYREMLQRQWEEGQMFRERRLQEVKSMRGQREHLLQQHMFEEARRLEETIADTLEEADYIPRTTLA
ncbi:short transient receptor potential channel 7-like isoform X1 [Ostrea edulis]|uniref:short transient receptor potential channel 7-like isoform X1 n=1 Tax=Ostrea edulis TaxID=37623 RepID=UPI0020963660|nr:short transient receptor potential channel 7-like isoform X1 [Ostrea edulis]